MLTRSTKIRVIAFAVISVVFIVYALLRFTDLDRLFGDSGYRVALQLEDTGGIFPSAEVVYRGVPVGKVGKLELTDDGLEAQLRIEPDAPPIPSDLKARIANRSVVGEQFVGLQPQSRGGPYLTGGTTIPSSKVSLPVRTEDLIGDLNNLATSVPRDSLRTVVDETYKAFHGTGEDLGALLDRVRDFNASAQENLPETVDLLKSSGTVLDTQNDVAGEFKSFSSDLRDLTGTLKSSDSDLRDLIDITPKVSKTVDDLVRETGPGVSSLLANLLTTSDIVATRLDGIEQGLVTYPMLSAGAQSVAPGDGYAHLGFALNFFDPPPCVKGYPRAKQQVESDDDDGGYRTGADVSDRSVPDDTYCAEPKGSPIEVRGAQNVPYNGDTVDPSDREVSQHSDRDEETLMYMRGIPGPATGPGMEITDLGDLLGL